MEQGIDISRFVNALLRRWWLVLLPVVILTPAVAIVAYKLPSSYSATARIAVITQQITRDLVQSTVDVSVTQRIALIEQQLMTRENLLEIAELHNVVGARDMSPDQIISMMRESTEIGGISVREGRSRQATGINITFTADRPAVAANVANEMQARLREQNLRQRSSRATETSAFFRDEVRRLENELSALGREIAQFKNENADALPDSLEFRRSQLASLQQKLFERELQIAALEQEREALETALASGDLSAAGAEARRRSPEERELERLRNALAQQRAVYADTHPSIRSLNSRIARLEEVVVEQAEAVAATSEPAAGETDAGMSEAVAEVRRRLEQVVAQLDLLSDRRDSERAEAEALRASIERTPDIELALRTLERRVANAQAEYREAVAKRNRAEAGERLELNQQAERFEILEQAVAPSRPDSPNRPLIIAAGFVGSGGLGVAIVILLELLNGSIRTARDLERQIGLRPVVSIPYIVTSRELARRRWTIRAAVMLLALGVPASLLALDRFYAPLPVLIERVADRTGLARVAGMVETRFGL